MPVNVFDTAFRKEASVDITDSEFRQIVVYFKDHYGVNLTDKKLLVIGRLDNYLTKNSYVSYTQFFNKVKQNPKGDEAVALLNYLTTNHTYFMREPVHFDFMKDIALPEIKKSDNGSRDIRIWSAAASTGEEAYTMAMVMRDFFQSEINSWDTTVLATDISRRALETASIGEYSVEQVQQLPEAWAHRYFDKIGNDKMRIKDEIRKQVLFRYFNLMEDFPFKKKFHLVFLRNVMIYFDETTKSQLIEKIYDYMEPGGYLIIGTTETFERSHTRFKYVQPSIYRKARA